MNEFEISSTNSGSIFEICNGNRRFQTEFCCVNVDMIRNREISMAENLMINENSSMLRALYDYGHSLKITNSVSALTLMLNGRAVDLTS